MGGHRSDLSRDYFARAWTPGDKHARPTGGERSEALEAAPPPVPPPALPSLGGEPLAADALPTDAVPWTALAGPPALGNALMQGGGSGGGPVLEYYALDALGSVRVVFDATGAVKARADYEPFGAPVPASTTGPLPREQFTGQQRDSEVGLDYFGARFYHATHGRMLSVDPLYAGAMGDPQRWNRYAYASNSPIVLTDPDGRTACTTTVRNGGFTIGCPNGGDNSSDGDGRPSVITTWSGYSPMLGAFDHSTDDYFCYMYGCGYINPNPGPGLGVPLPGQTSPAQQDPASSAATEAAGDHDSGTGGITITGTANIDVTVFGSGGTVSVGSGWTGRRDALPRPVFLGTVGAAVGMPKTSYPSPGSILKQAMRQIVGIGVSGSINFSLGEAPVGYSEKAGASWVVGVGPIRVSVSTAGSAMTGVSIGLGKITPVAFSVKGRQGGTYRPW